ncbi:MAG: ABC transporter substrate-binding protein [Myxococcota bacterium]
MTGPRRSSRLPLASIIRVGALVAWLATAATHGAPAVAEPPAASPIRRVVSLYPSLSAIAVSLGAADRLVGVDDWTARQEPALADRPRVGGLYNPSLEAVVALRPDLVMLVPSAEQSDFRARVEALGIRVEAFENIAFDQVLENIERIGRLLDREAAAGRRIREIERTRARVAAAVAPLAPPRTIVVLQREPLFIAGRGNFIDEMVTAAGGRNLGRPLGEAYPRVSLEWAIEAAPQVILDLGPDPGEARAFWGRWPSLPAVRDGRVLTLDASLVSLPGPDLDRSLETLARALHGDRLGGALPAAPTGSEPAATARGPRP